MTRRGQSLRYGLTIRYYTPHLCQVFARSKARISGFTLTQIGRPSGYLRRPARYGYNMALSQRRAQAAVDYLVSRGITSDRMVAGGYGETRLVNNCGNGVPCSREQHQANRRTEVTVLEY